MQISVNHDDKTFWNIIKSSLKSSAAQTKTEIYPWVWKHLETTFNDLNSVSINETIEKSENLPVWHPVSVDEAKLQINSKVPGPDLVLPSLLQADVS